MEQLAIPAEKPQKAPKIELVFSNGAKGVYRWKLGHATEEANLEKAEKLQKRIAGIKITSLDNQEQTWRAKSAPHYVQPRPATTNPRKTTKRTIIRELFQTEQPRDETPKERQSHWLFTPGNVEKWRHATLVKHLKAAYQKNQDADQFLAYLRMILAIYQCDFLNLAKTVLPGDFYFEIRDIYNTNQQWSPQMMAALPEIKFMFTRIEWASLTKQLAAQKRQDSQESLAKMADLPLVTPESDPAAAQQNPEMTEMATSISPEKPKKKLTKSQRQKIKHFKNQQPTKTKKRGLFF